ncbi:MAG: DUF1294 domain-containing protein [Bacteroidaceae bacterium]|nr:DUF1294 domain-containing protein [Bacteroidaceae bacterium]
MYHNALFALVLFNLITFIIYGIDKFKAKKGMWRISESTLLFLALLGGSVGAWVGIKMWRHKTQHWKFRIGVPLIIIIQIALIGGILVMKH